MRPRRVPRLRVVSACDRVSSDRSRLRLVPVRGSFRPVLPSVVVLARLGVPLLRGAGRVDPACRVMPPGVRHRGSPGHTPRPLSRRSLQLRRGSPGSLLRSGLCCGWPPGRIALDPPAIDGDLAEIDHSGGVTELDDVDEELRERLAVILPEVTDRPEVRLASSPPDT